MNEVCQKVIPTSKPTFRLGILLGDAHCRGVSLFDCAFAEICGKVLQEATSIPLRAKEVSRLLLEQLTSETAAHFQRASNCSTGAAPGWLEDSMPEFQALQILCIEHIRGFC